MLLGVFSFHHAFERDPDERILGNAMEMSLGMETSSA